MSVLSNKLMQKILFKLVLIVFTLFFFSCDENNNFNVFSLEDDINLGAQVSQEIASKPDQFPLLDRSQYNEAYNYLQNIADKILNSGQVTYAEEFVWQVNIIHDDSTLNAFATPGGYIYVYTGLIKFLDKEDDLAGVLAHEIAHADQRHTTRQLQRAYGLQVLLSVALGNDPGALEEIAGAIAGNLATLSFSRGFEEEADEYSVIYLAETNYQCNGAFSFFQKLIDLDQAGNPPKFLSTHPDPEDRIQDINEKAEEIGCDTTPADPSSYETFKNSLPN